MEEPEQLHWPCIAHALCVCVCHILYAILQDLVRNLMWLDTANSQSEHCPRTRPEDIYESVRMRTILQAKILINCQVSQWSSDCKSNQRHVIKIHQELSGLKFGWSLPNETRINHDKPTKFGRDLAAQIITDLQVQLSLSWSNLSSTKFFSIWRSFRSLAMALPEVWIRTLPKELHETPSRTWTSSSSTDCRKSKTSPVGILVERMVSKGNLKQTLPPCFPHKFPSILYTSLCNIVQLCTEFLCFSCNCQEIQKKRF